MKKRTKHRSKNNGRSRCVSTKNSKSVVRCSAKAKKYDLCGIHKRSNILTLPDGSMWENVNKSGKISRCVKRRKAILFWDMLSGGYPWDSLDNKFKPSVVSDLRNTKEVYLRAELRRMGVCYFDKEFMKKFYVSPKRYFWFTNLYYFLGNFRVVVKRIERFYCQKVKPRILRRRKIVDKLSRAYRVRKIRKLLPKLVEHGKIWRDYGCVNLHDPITHENFVDVPPERWAICCDNSSDNCWWFDISSAVQLLGSPGSHAGENPYTRAEYPTEFVLDVDEKLQRLRLKYSDLKQLCEDHTDSSDISSCYDYRRYLTRVKAIRLFESFKEHGYVFPATVFVEFGLSELRALVAKIIEGWQVYPESERLRVFPETGQVFTPEFTRDFSTCGNVTELRTQILNAATGFVVTPKSFSDRASGCIHFMMILATINKRSHDIVKKYGLCDCTHHDDNEIEALDIGLYDIDTAPILNAVRNLSYISN